MRARIGLALGSGIACSAMLSLPAMAQTGAAQPDAPQTSTAPDATQQQPEATTSDIVVTALKRESTALKTPAALTVLSGADLQARGVNTLSDIQDVAPSVNIANGRDGLQVAIRGVTTTDTSSKGEQDIAFSIDGAYVGRGNARGGAFFDIDHIEILRGPQGTLYGRSSTGGAINVITNKPKLGVVEGYVKAEYGNYDTKRIEGAINIPIGDIVAIRLSAAGNERDGFSRPIDYSPSFFGTTYNFYANQSRARNDQKDATGRASILLKPSESFSLRLTGTFGHQRGVGDAPALQTQLAAHDDSGASALQVLTNPVPAFLRNNFEQYDAALNWKFASTQLDIIASHQILDFKQQNPSVQDAAANGGGAIYPCFGTQCDPNGAVPNGFAPFGPTFQFYYQQNHVKTDQVEARISNAAPGFIDYVVGANYYREAAGENGQSWNAELPSPYNPAQYVFQAGPVNVTTHKAYGIFGQGTVNVTERLGIVLGARYTHDEVNRVGRFALPYDFAAGFPPPPNPDANGNAICHYPDTCIGDPNNGGQSDNRVTWRVGLNFQATPAALFYASIATGFKGGGFNDYDPATGGIGQYQPASLTAYEIGYKGRPVAGLSFSSDVYYYDFSRFQVNSGVYLPNAGFGLFTVTTPVKLYGWENEFTYAVTSATSIDGAFTLEHSSFSDFITGENRFTPGQGVDFSGKPVDRAPGVNLIAGINHRIDLGSGALRLRANLKYSGAYYLSDYNYGVRFRQHPFTRTDLSVAYELSGGKYSIQGFVENIENKVQRTSMQGYGGSYGGTNLNGVVNEASDPPNNLAFYTTTPRFYGIRIAARF